MYLYTVSVYTNAVDTLKYDEKENLMVRKRLGIEKILIESVSVLLLEY